MENVNETTRQNQFIRTVLHGIDLDIDEFMSNLIHSQPYENTMYAWIINLYTKNVTVHDAITEIHRKRIQSLEQFSAKSTSEQAIAKKYKKVMRILDANTRYQRLKHEQKIITKAKVYALLNTNLYTYNNIAAKIIKIIMNQFYDKKSIPQMLS